MKYSTVYYFQRVHGVLYACLVLVGVVYVPVFLSRMFICSVPCYLYCVFNMMPLTSFLSCIAFSSVIPLDCLVICFAFIGFIVICLLLVNATFSVCKLFWYMCCHFFLPSWCGSVLF